MMNYFPEPFTFDFSVSVPFLFPALDPNHLNLSGFHSLKTARRGSTVAAPQYKRAVSRENSFDRIVEDVASEYATLRFPQKEQHFLDLIPAAGLHCKYRFLSKWEFVLQWLKLELSCLSLDRSERQFVGSSNFFIFFIPFIWNEWEFVGGYHIYASVLCWSTLYIWIFTA